MEGHPEVVTSGGGVREFNESGTSKTLVKPAPHEALLLMSLRRAPICHPASIIRLDALREHSIQYDNNFHYAHDVKLWADLIRVGYIGNIDDIILNYRRHANQATQKHLIE